MPPNAQCALWGMILGFLVDPLHLLHCALGIRQLGGNLPPHVTNSVRALVSLLYRALGVNRSMCSPLGTIFVTTVNGC